MPQAERQSPQPATLDDAQLLGFEHVGPEGRDAARPEDAMGVAFNKRGLGGEGAPKAPVTRA